MTDDLQIHLLELSKLRVTAENVYHESAIERWAFFLQNAAKLTPDDVGRLFPDQEIAEAAGILNMISQTPEQNRLYEARLKYERDQAAILEGALDEARLEGLIEGEAKGEVKGQLFGQIKTLQQILGVAQSTNDELSHYDATQLKEMAEKLQLQLRHRDSRMSDSN